VRAAGGELCAKRMGRHVAMSWLQGMCEAGEGARSCLLPTPMRLCYCTNGSRLNGSESGNRRSRSSRNRTQAAV
jgi:hypothetical protein